MARDNAQRGVRASSLPAVAATTGLDVQVEADATELAFARHSQSYNYPLSALFRAASVLYPEVDIRTERKAGAPCIAGTRIPVYVILDAVQGSINFESVARSYPSLSREQIEQAVAFARFVVECPIEQLATAS